MTTNIERAARRLYDHRLSIGDFPDGVTEWEDLPEPWQDEWREAAEFLAESQPPILMPDLPAPSRDMVSPAGKVWYSNGPLSDVRATRDGIVAFGSWKETPFRVQLTAAQAEELAGILWAAARHHAEQEHGNE